MIVLNQRSSTRLAVVTLAPQTNPYCPCQRPTGKGVNNFLRAYGVERNRHAGHPVGEKPRNQEIFGVLSFKKSVTMAAL
jgi:hypothetical protein